MSFFERLNLALTGGLRRGERSVFVRYLVAFSLIGMSTGVAMWLRPDTYRFPYLAYYAAILVSLLYGGLGPGLLATVLSALLVNYLFLPPYGQFGTDLFAALGGFYFCLSFGLICWLIDTRWRRTEGQLETQLRLLDAATEPVIMRDKQDRIIYWNKGAEDVYGWTRREAIGQTITELLHTEYPGPTAETNALLQSAGQWSGELKRTKRDGVEVLVRSAWTVDRGPRDSFTILEVDYDITEQRKVEALLHEREDLYRDLVEHSTDLICTYTLEGRLLFINELPAKLLGYSREEVLNRPMRDFILPEARSQFDESLLRIQKEGFVKGRMVVLTKSGEQRIWEYHNTLRFSDVAVPIVRGIAHDITEKKQLERALRLSEDKFSKAFRSSPIESVITEFPEGRFVDCNIAFEQNSGFSRAEIIGRTSIELGIFKNSKDREAAVQEILNNDALREMEIEFRTKSGKLRIKRCSAEKLDIAGQRCVLIVFQDITDYKLAEKALQQSEANYRSIFAASMEAITVADREGNFGQINEAACQMFGWTRDELLGMSIFDVLAPEEAGRLAELSNTLTTGEVNSGEWLSRRKDGTKFLAEVGVTVMADGRILGIGRDISARKRAEERICLLAQAVENSAELIGITDLEGRVLVVNHALLDATGYQENEIVGNFFGKLFVSQKNSLDMTRDILAQTLSGSGWRGEFLHPRKDGTEFPTFLTTGQIRDSKGVLIGLYGISQDITFRKKAETELRESKDRLQIALELTDLGTWEFNLEDNTAIRSLRHDQIFGYRTLQPDWSYEKFISHVLPQYRAEIHRRFEDSHVSGTWEIDAQIRRVDGELRWIWARGHHFVNNLGGPVRMFGTIMDITDRKRVDEGLRLNEERLRLAQVAAGLGIFEVEIPSGKRTWSPKVFEIFGFPPETPQNSLEDSIRFTHPEDRPLVEQQTALLLSGSAVHFEHRIIRGDGEVRWLEVFGISDCDVSGRPARYLGTCKDITERKQMEAQLRQSQKMEAVGQLAGGVAHDFNNLMGVILGYSDLLIDRTLPDEVYKKHLDSIRVAVQSAAAVTRQLLAFSRKQVLHPVVVDLNVSVQQMNRMIRRLIGENIQVVLRLEPNPCFVKADPGQIEQILMNLVVNSRDAMQDGGELRIETTNIELGEEFVKLHLGSATGDFVKLSVTDSGVGMSREVLIHIFEPFFTTKGVDRGTGLGLATVYGIVKQSQGYIWVKSDPGAGTSFDIYLPRIEGIPAPEHPLTAVTVARGSETILLVEDEPALRELTQEQLEMSGYRVLAASDAESALALFAKRSEEVSLLLTDVIMPGMNGRVLGENLKGKRPGLRVLFMSGYTDDDILRNGVSGSQQSILMKPFTRAALATRIREILDGTPEHLDAGSLSS
ncbi:MAG: PAS domain S-box protein [Candidatus Acidiferrum sp.]